MIEVPVFKFALSKDVIDSLMASSFLPKRAHPNDTGWDVRSAITCTIRPGQYVKIPLGFRMFAPRGWWLELRPRSSTFAKKQLHALYGVIDEGFENIAMLVVDYIPDISAMAQDLQINFGDAIGQVIPVRRQEMITERITDEEYETLCKERNSSRGTGGFGSSSK